MTQTSVRDWIADRLGRIGDIEEAIRRIDALSDHSDTGPVEHLALGLISVSLLLRAKRLNDAWRRYRLLALRHAGSRIEDLIAEVAATSPRRAIAQAIDLIVHIRRTAQGRTVESIVSVHNGPDGLSIGTT